MKSQSVLVVAAHPDDEVLGCGGTIAKLADSGAEVHITFIADGVSSRAGDVDLNRRRSAATAACDLLGVESVWFGELPDNRLDSVPLLEIAKLVEDFVARYQPDTLFTHHAGDLNIDHRRIHDAVVVACRPQARHSVKTLLCYEVPSSTEWQLPLSAPAFTPNWFVDISMSLTRKLAALELYNVELRPWPHPRSRRGVEALATWRGATIGTDAAEAFMLGRRIE